MDKSHNNARRKVLLRPLWMTPYQKKETQIRKSKCKSSTIRQFIGFCTIKKSIKYVIISKANKDVCSLMWFKFIYLHSKQYTTILKLITRQVGNKMYFRFWWELSLREILQIIQLFEVTGVLIFWKSRKTREKSQVPASKTGQLHTKPLKHQNQQ